MEARDIKKAMINIPMFQSSKGRTLCVEEEDVFEGYKVTSIEKDRVRLNRHDEEYVITTNSGLKHFKQGGNEGKEIQEGLAKLDSKLKVVEGPEVEEEFDPGAKKVAHEDMHDESFLSLEYKEPEYFSMPVFEDSHLAEADEIEEDDTLFPYCSFPD